MVEDRQSLGGQQPMAAFDSVSEVEWCVSHIILFLKCHIK